MRELESISWWNAGMRDVAERMLGRIGLPDSGMLLDVGCGSGQTMAWFRGMRPRWSALGLDVALDGLVAARELEEEVVAGSALDLPLPDASADLLITLDVIQHLPLDGGDLKAFREMHRVLRPGGHVFIRTNAQAFPFTPDDPEYNFHKYEPAEIRDKLTHAGFSVLRLSRINGLLGLAEIPRELRALRREGRTYHGILSQTTGHKGPVARLKRWWLGLEGRAVDRGVSLPMGRTLLALARR
jgi:SAM-dependent methyltransferase